LHTMRGPIEGNLSIVGHVIGMNST